GLYLISPFPTAVAGIRNYRDQYCKENTGRTRINSRYILDHDQKKIGTVHTFQGKEADEVIFLLGCDPGEGAKGAVRWVNRNIVNVAATRAKFRLYVIGDEDAWKESACISAAKNIIDTFAIKEIKSILEQDLQEEERREALLKASAGLPSVTAFSTAEVEYEEDAVDYSIDTSGLIQGLNEEFLTTELTSSQLGKFGFDSGKALDQLSGRVRDNLLLGMKLYFLLEPVYRVNPGFDASCCAILFCKAMELRMKDCFLKSLQELFPEFKIRGMGKGRGTVALKDAKYEELTLGAFGVILRNHRAELGRRMQAAGNPQYDENWWRAFEARLQDCANRRNQCCHSGLFSWMDHLRLLADLFRVDKTKGRDPKIGGILFESAVGMGLSGSEQV
ncbi:AAA domain-containing protein, partial [Schaedlerella sp.]|uniref:AAA domain-containing protein n=1 Tax=Schaedlerella sp. TaxID=2676057 RepID=UPI003745AC95